MANLLFSPKIRLALILPAVAVLGVAVPLTWIVYSSLLQAAIATQLQNTLPLVSSLLAEDLSRESETMQAKIAGLSREEQLRITIIDDSGQVLADSARTWSQVQSTENHSQRAEVVTAREEGEGSKVRRSATTGLVYVYAAKTVVDSKGRLLVVRLAQPVQGLKALRQDLTMVILVAMISAMVAIGGWLWWLQWQISRAVPELLESAQHLESGDFSCRIDVSSRTEFGRLGGFLNRIAAQAEGQIQELTTRSEHLLAVVLSMREGVLVTDGEGFTRLANPAFRRLFGISGETDGLTPLEITRQTRLEDLIVNTLSTGEPQLADIEIETPTTRTIAIATTSLDQKAGVVLVARDTTELVLLGQMGRDFVANVSHELKTPLTAIRGYAETLRYSDIDEPETGFRFLDRILQQCTRLQALLEDLLTLSRLESLDDRIERTVLHLDKLLEDCLDSITPQATEKEITLDVESQSMSSLDGDRNSLERLVINLLDNAVKYNRLGGSVKARLLQHDGEMTFEVIDTGIGIPSHCLNRVFERFYRVDKGRSRDEGGTGLGLAIVKHVAQLHGGRVEVESRLGEGSVFRVHLPTHPD